MKPDYVPPVVTEGGRAGSEFEQCPKCGGSGKLSRDITTYPFGCIKIRCRFCHGAGFIPSRREDGMTRKDAREKICKMCPIKRDDIPALIAELQRLLHDKMWEDDPLTPQIGIGIKVRAHEGTAHTDAVSEQLPSPSSEERSD